MKRLSILFLVAMLIAACDITTIRLENDPIPNTLAGQVVHRINELRDTTQTCDLPQRFGESVALTWSNQLAQAAEVQAQDLIATERLARVGQNDFDAQNRCSPNELPVGADPLLDPHCHSDGSAIDDRVVATGYDFGGRAFHTSEIIALTNPEGIQISSDVAIQQTETDVVELAVQGWLKSPPHCSQMLRERNRQIGVHTVDLGEGLHLWVAVFTGQP